MGVRIVASGTSFADGHDGAIALARSAARSCLASAGVVGADVDILIYVGVYRDDNIVEPAIAALVQRDIGMSLDFAKTSVAGFSFDLLNSGCGIVNAMQVASAYLHGGAVRRVLLVSSDAHPSGRAAPDFPFAAVGGALLLEHDADATAPRFGRLQVRDGDDGDGVGPGSEGFLSFATAGTNGRDHITVVRDGDYEPRALALLSSSILEYAAAEGLRLDETLIVTSCLSPGFGERVAAAVGVAADRVLSATGVDRDPLSSALTLAWDQAARGGRLHGREPILFAAVGGGLTSTCMVWRR
jgi:3-oxoacyl-[acyl-carrier-protein] synthase-3